ncbi:BIRC2_3 [Mytilus edulis]|uniref:BIRC2_3 n=1 Tax=Mytilus edulis TaxID=6550 RepID=A0A8S3Q6B3_MYTED|nr:BIRC2_3 [Mytilus edulis]
MDASPVQRPEHYQLFVFYDDSDEQARDDILPVLESEHISFSSLQENGMPGTYTFDTAFSLVAKSRKVLIIFSKSLSVNKKSSHMIKSACTEPSIRRKIITLITNGKVSSVNGLFCLRDTSIIRFNTNWVSNLKTELLTIIPSYSILHANTGASNFVSSKGLLLQQMDMDLYGVLITARNKNFLIDLPEFYKHINEHTKLNIPQACEDCGFLCDLNTTISLGFTDDFLETEEEKFGDSEMSKGLLELMKCVMDAYNPHSKSNLWSVSCSVSGEYKPSHAYYINDMFGSVVYALLNKAASKMQVPFLPEFEDIDKRRETLKNIEDQSRRETIALAGFVCIAEPDRMQCFQCGWHIPLSAMDLEPMLYHASYMPLCPYVQQTLAPERFPPYRVHHKKFDNSDLSTEDDGDEDFQKFADAGFYRNGFEHVIECMSCGLCIIINNANTSPWDTHALLSPTCKFVLEKKGIDFIKSVNAQRSTDKEPTIITYALTDFSFDHRTNWPSILFTPDTI